MFMFRSRRNALLKQLWRRAAVRHSSLRDADSAAQPGEDVLLLSSSSSSSEDTAAPDRRQHSNNNVGSSWIKSAAHALFKRLTDDQLSLLLDAVEGGPLGADTSPCLPLPFADTLVAVDRVSSPEGAQQILCRLFRWPELALGTELKRVTSLCEQQQQLQPPSSNTLPPTQSTSRHSSSTCCNPYHWCRLSDVAPPPYSRLVMNHDRPAGRLVSYPTESLETGGTNQYSSTGSNPGGIGGNSGRSRPWCTLAYWELRQRVGRLFPVTSSSVAIFADETPHRESAAGLCLTALTGQRAPESDAVRRTRQKVGLGLLLCHEPDGVWMYNRSENPVFVNSPTLDPPGTGPSGAPRTLLVYKVPSGYAIRVFDHERSQLYQTQQCSVPVDDESLTDGQKITDYTDGPFDPNALRISFAKGWGPKYSRQFITSCPCWIEVLLAGPSR